MARNMCECVRTMWLAALATPAYFSTSADRTYKGVCGNEVIYTVTDL